MFNEFQNTFMELNALKEDDEVSVLPGIDEYVCIHSKKLV